MLHKSQINFVATIREQARFCSGFYATKLIWLSKRPLTGAGKFLILRVSVANEGVPVHVGGAPSFLTGNL